jgi:hypothetical protein
MDRDWLLASRSGVFQLWATSLQLSGILLAAKHRLLLVSMLILHGPCAKDPD